MFKCKINNTYYYYCISFKDPCVMDLTSSFIDYSVNIHDLFEYISPHICAYATTASICTHPSRLDVQLCRKLHMSHLGQTDGWHRVKAVETQRNVRGLKAINGGVRQMKG